MCVAFLVRKKGLSCKCDPVSLLFSAGATAGGAANGFGTLFGLYEGGSNDND